MPHPSRQATDQPGCTRCGKCCTKGGPAFHREDLPLVETGAIPAKFLYTIRKGETVRDNVRGVLIQSPSDIIKIKGEGGDWQCRFYDREKQGCSIYENRPLECRVLQCWDTTAIENVCLKDLLTRQDLLAEASDLWPLIEDHEARCGYERLARWIHALDNGRNTSALDRIHKAVWYDTWIRRLIVEKGGDPDMLDFLLGRPLTKTMSMFGLNLKKKGDRYYLVPKGGKFFTPPPEA